MSRDIDARDHDWRSEFDDERRPTVDQERPDLSRGSRPDADARETPSRDPGDVFTREFRSSRGLDRQHYELRGRTYTLRYSELRTLATVGAFRVVPASDFRDHAGRELDTRKSDLQHLQRSNLVRTHPHVLNGQRTKIVSLTREGRDLLNAYRPASRDAGQRFYAGLVKPRELAHDAHLYRAYLRSADRLVEQGARINRVVLDYELKRDYQQFLQDGNRDRPDSDGRPTRDAEEIQEWAFEHHLPEEDGHVLFPDVRIEYELPDGRRAHEDIEVMTAQYRGAHASAKGRAGFTQYRAATGFGRGTGGRAAPFDPRVAEDFL